VTVGMRPCSTTSGPSRPAKPNTGRQRHVHLPKERRSINPFLRTGANDRPPRIPYQRGPSSTRPHGARPDPCATRRYRCTSGGTYAGLAHPAHHRAPAAAGRHPAVEGLIAGAHSFVPLSRPLMQRGPDELLGAITRSGFLAPQQNRYCKRRAKAASRFSEVHKAMVKAPWPLGRGSRVILDVVYNHTGRGRPTAGPDAGPSAGSTNGRPTTGSMTAEQLAATIDIQPAAATASTSGTRTPCSLIMGLACGTGSWRWHGRRVPLRPGLGAWPAEFLRTWTGLSTFFDLVQARTRWFFPG